MVLVTGCGQTVVLGSECPNEPGACLAKTVEIDATLPVQDADVTGPLDGNALVGDAQSGQDAEQVEPQDAGSTEAAVFDAGAEAAVDAGPQAAFPSIGNGSFEITSGSAGDIAFQPPTGPIVNPIGAQIRPWTSCRSGVKVLASYDPGDGSRPATPQEGSSFVLDQLALGNPVGLNQQLGEPLRAGVSYAFSIALRVAKAGESVSLNVFGTDVPCLGVPLAQSRAITETSWQRVCIKFTPASGHSSLMLAASAELSGAALLMDDLRYDASCAAQ